LLLARECCGADVPLTTKAAIKVTRCGIARIVKVAKPKVTVLQHPTKKMAVKMPVLDPWNPPELVGKSKGKAHDYFEHLGRRAAREGKKVLKDAHGAWLHEWIMEMENTGKLVHFES
jgi:hypothetical protein